LIDSGLSAIKLDRGWATCEFPVMKKLLCTIAVAIPLLALGRDGTDAWKPFEFIIGDWTGGGNGSPGQGQGEFSLKPDLANKILVRRNHNEYPAQAGRPAFTHDDLMVIYPPQGGGPYRAEYFDSEGHVIHYVASFSEGKVTFVSDDKPNAARYQLTYEKKADDSLGINFAIAPPNQDFHHYLGGTVVRK
jgi:hypothetical protein